jgi:lysozyme
MRSSQPKKISCDGLDLIKHFEGLFLQAYRCPAGVWTIGYGHTGIRHNDGTVKPGRRITAAQAEELLRLDMSKYEAAVNRLVTVPLAQHEFDALVSFHFNTGALGKSTLLRRLNAGAYAEVPHQLRRWTRANGKVLKGLVRRRQSESLLWQNFRPFIVPG